MTKFKSGDKVVPINKTVKGYDTLSDSKNWNDAQDVNQPFLYIQYFDDVVNAYVCNLDENTGAGCYFNESDLISYKKVTKNQRIATLENEVAELKLIVHELRERPQLTTVINNSTQGPSTSNTVEDIIEFEGKQYRKVNREALEGDVVILNDIGDSDYFEVDKPYKVEKEILIEGTGKNYGYKESFSVYKESHNRTPNTVDVYELIVEEKPLTPNQQRAAVIEKAKKFVKQNLANGRTSNRTAEKGNSTYRDNYYEVDFFVKEGKVTAVVYWLVSNEKRIVKPSNVGRAKCSPNDVFNEHIGKAIALGRALGLDVSEFEQAVQPTEKVLGMIVEWKGEAREISRQYIPHETCNPGSDRSVYGTIINDTNAIYGGVE